MTISKKGSGAVLAALDAISRLVPPAGRDAWLGEWRAEFLHLFEQPGAASRSPYAHLGMAFRHAWWLRRNPSTSPIPKGGNMLEHLRHAARALRREPSFTVPALLTLTLGIGANVAVFSVIEAVLLRPLPYASADRLVMINHRDLRAGVTKNNVSSNDMIDIAARQKSFEALVPYGSGRTAIYGFAEPIDVAGIQASPALFDVAGVTIALGRGLGPADCRPGAAPVVIIGYDLWQTQFKGDPAVVGRSITVGSASRTIVGVAPRGFSFPPVGRVDVIAPLMQPASVPVPRTIGSWVFAAGRLRPGVSVETADAELKALSASLAAEFPATNRGTQYYGLSVRDALAGDATRPLLLLGGAVAVLLIIALVNVGNLLLVRGTARQGEFALRVALGAGRARLFSQLLAENLLLTCTAAIAGVALAYWGAGALVALIPPTVSLPALKDVRLNFTVLGYAAFVAVAAGVLFSVFAAIYSGRGRQAVISERRHTMSKGARRTASLFVVIEVALAVTLLVGAGLIVRSFSALLNVNPGFDRAGVSAISLSLPPGKYNAGTAAAELWGRLIVQLQAMPGVEAAGLAQVTPLTGNNWTVPLIRADRPVEAGQRPPDVGWQVASGGYFQALKIPLRAGRFFTDADANGAPVAVVSESIEHRYFDKGESAVGRRVKLGKEDAEIVGVVGDIRRAALTDAPRADMYLPAERGAGPQMTAFVRTANGAPIDYAAFRSTVRALEPGARIEPAETLAGIAEDSAAPTRLVMWLLGVFSAVALLLAAVGVYGVLSYAVRQRLREFATRAALGATSGDILWMVMRQGTVIVMAGLAAGVSISLVATRTLQSLLFSVTPYDPVTIVAAALLLLAATVLGCYLPARRAARAEPARALAE